MYTSVLEQENVLNIEYMQILWKTGMILTIVSTPNENMISEQSRAWRLPNSENLCSSRERGDKRQKFEFHHTHLELGPLIKKLKTKDSIIVSLNLPPLNCVLM